MGETLYLLDGHSQIFRAYYAPFRDLTSPTGEPTRATYVFCSMLLKLIADRRPKYLAMAVDGPKEKLLRRQRYDQYKITRKPTPEDFHPQAKRIIEIVAAMGIPVLEAEGYEADDIMATAVESLAGTDLDVVLISRDKDLDQLVGPHVVLYDPMKDETLDAAAIEAQKGYPPAKAIEVQTLTGDSTDNIPGIQGVGPKTAVKLIAQYGTADAVVAHADELTPKLRQNVLAGAETLALSRELVTLDRHVPIELDVEAMAFGGVDGEAVRPIFAELGFNRLVDQLAKLGAGGEAKVDVAAAAAAGGQTAAGDFQYRCVDTPEALETLVGQLAGVGRLAVDTETTSTQPMRAELVGISLAARPGEAVYLPVAGPLGATTLPVEIVREKLAGLLADEKVQKIGHNLKYDLIVLAQAGMPLGGPLFDTMVAAHVLDSTRMTYKLDALAAELLDHRCIPIEDLIGRGKQQTTMDAVPVEIVAPYAAEDADVALRLADVLARQLEEEGLTDLFARLEMPLVSVLAAMEREGILVEPEALNRMAVALSKQADALRDRILALASHPFNVDSPKQLAGVLFEELNLPVLKKTKTGPSTDSTVLEQLAIRHELPGLVLDYRKLTKLLGTYLKALGAYIHPRTGRVHTSFHQAGTATGRLSSSDPNLQNIPIRTEQGREIRSAFVAPPGCVLLSADYSQVELRVLAHLCGDETLAAAFRAGQDIHRAVAAEVFGVSPEDVTPEQRARAKTVNFGIIYGQTAFGLSISLRIPRRQAAEFISRYRSRFPKIDEFLGRCIRAAKGQGYVETIFGRRRRIPEIDARDPQHRAAAERLAINSVVQGSAADLIKQAMVNIARRIDREHRPSRMLLQIHDELLFELPEGALEPEREMIVEEMAGAIKLDVPLNVDVGVGKNWMEAK
ncbi:MAG TPA: DNA polymerase I [Phycisphaerae bacterium]|nr:DNA polymerase I [Phycisphaerae bacterium]